MRGWGAKNLSKKSWRIFARQIAYKIDWKWRKQKRNKYAKWVKAWIKLGSILWSERFGNFIFIVFVVFCLVLTVFCVLRCIPRYAMHSKLQISTEIEIHFKFTTNFQPTYTEMSFAFSLLYALCRLSHTRIFYFTICDIKNEAMKTIGNKIHYRDSVARIKRYRLRFASCEDGEIQRDLVCIDKSSKSVKYRTKKCCTHLILHMEMASLFVVCLCLRRKQTNSVWLSFAARISIYVHFVELVEITGGA